jgi:hypothetical protein
VDRRRPHDGIVSAPLSAPGFVPEREALCRHAPPESARCMHVASAEKSLAALLASRYG